MPYLVEKVGSAFVLLRPFHAWNRLSLGIKNGIGLFGAIYVAKHYMILHSGENHLSSSFGPHMAV